MRNALLAAHLARAWRAGSCSAVVGVGAALGRARAQTFGCYGRGPIAAGDASAGVCRRIAYAWRRCTASECTVVRAETRNSNAVVGVIAGVFACGKRDHGSHNKCSADLHRTSLDPFHAAQERTDQVSGSKRGQEVGITPLCITVLHQQDVCAKLVHPIQDARWSTVNRARFRQLVRVRRAMWTTASSKSSPIRKRY